MERRRNELGVLAKGTVGDSIVSANEWDMYVDLKAPQGKLNGIFEDAADREELENYFKDKMRYMKKAIRIFRDPTAQGRKIKEQYRGRLMDLTNDLYEHAQAKASEMTLEPIVREMVTESAAYINGNAGGRNALARV